MRNSRLIDHEHWEASVLNRNGIVLGDVARIHFSDFLGALVGRDKLPRLKRMDVQKGDGLGSFQIYVSLKGAGAVVHVAERAEQKIAA